MRPMTTVPCPSADEQVICKGCKEWTEKCSPCCPETEDCGQCDGSGEIDNPARIDMTSDVD